MKTYIKFLTPIMLFCIACFQQIEAQLQAFEPNLSGKYEITASAKGSNASTYTITIRKPVGATTAYKIYLYNAGSVYNPEATGLHRDLLSNIIRVDGTDYTFPLSARTSAPNSTPGYIHYGYSGAVTGNIQTKLDAAPAGSNVNFTISEGTISQNIGTDGVGIIIIWNNPTKPVGSHYVYLGMELITTAGKNINVPISPIDKTITGFEPILGIGISHSNSNFANQRAKITINANTLTEYAGGSDDNLDTAPDYGNFITLGGYGDNPNADNNDELYNISSILQNGDDSFAFVFSDVEMPNEDYVNAIYFSGIGITPEPCNLEPPVTDTPIINTCPSATVNLNSQGHLGTIPGNAELVWYTTATRDAGTEVSNPATSGAGVYYAFYYDSEDNCYSPASQAVTVTINNCADCTDSGITSVNLNQLYTGTFPTGVVLEWWSTSTRVTGTKVNDPTQVTVSGTYYAFFHDTVNNCYNTDNSTAAVTVNILPQCTVGCVDYWYGIRNGMIHKISTTDYNHTDTGFGLTGGTSTFSLAWGSDNNLYYAVGRDLYRFNPANNTSTDTLIDLPAFSGTSTVYLSGAADPQGNLYFIQNYGNLLAKVNSTTNTVTSVWNSIPTGTGGPTGVSFGGDNMDLGIAKNGDLYFVEDSRKHVWKVPAGTSTPIYQGKINITNQTYISDIWFKGNGMFVSTTPYTGTAVGIYKVNTNTWNSTQVSTDNYGYADVAVKYCSEDVCTQPGATGMPDGYSKVGITVQQKQAAWPESIPNGWIALESKTKGFVITRVSHVGGTDGTPASSDAIADPKEGMIVYDIQDNCVKLFNGTVWNCIEKSCNY